MWLNRTTKPAKAPVSLDEVKAHLRVQTTAEDALIRSYIDAATDLLDGRYGLLGRSIVTQGWEFRFNRFPSGRGVIELPLPPLRSVASVKYVDANGRVLTLDTADYVVETGEYFGEIRPAFGMSWPPARPEPNAVRVTFEAGFGDAADVPTPIKQAILLMVGEWHRGREDMVINTVPGPVRKTVDALIEPYRARRLP